MFVEKLSKDEIYNLMYSTGLIPYGATLFEDIGNPRELTVPVISDIIGTYFIDNTDPMFDDDERHIKFVSFPDFPQNITEYVYPSQRQSYYDWMYGKFGDEYRTAYLESLSESSLGVKI